MNIIFFDIDGTLALGKDVPPSAAEGIRLVREKGDLVFICTGRGIRYVKNNFSAYADGFITNNGRLAFYKDEVIFDEPLDKDVQRKILEVLRQSEVGYVFHGKYDGHYGGPADLFETMSAVGDPGYMSYGVDEKEDYYNFDFSYKDPKDRDGLKEALKKYCIMNPHGPHPSVDMSVYGIDKADALRHVAQRLQVDIDHTYAFGDGFNDITMLKAAGHGIAMGNGQEKTKEAAEYVTKRIDEDGVYRALKHYKLI